MVTLTIVSAKFEHPHDERAPAAFEPDTLLASQYFDRIRRRSEHHGEKMLMIAVLEDAVNTYLKYAGSPDHRHRELFAEAKDWVESDDQSWFYSFRNVCDVLGLDATYLRRGLRTAEVRGQHRDPVIQVRSRDDDEPLRGAGGA
jgi:hypothetical protein